MWIRKTPEEVAALPRKDHAQRVRLFAPIVVAALFTGMAILNLAAPPAEATLFFLAIFFLSCELQAHLQDFLSSNSKSRVDHLDPDSHLFCPECRLLRSHQALCLDCRGPLEPMAHWKWVETSYQLPSKIITQSESSVAAAAKTENITSTPSREIHITLPIARRRLASQIGITHSRLLKDISDRDLLAAVNPRLADRELLAHLGRKYHIAFRFL